MNHEALSNHLVLQSIFTNLENNDLEACCEVNKYWNAIADPLLIRYYDIKLNHSNSPCPIVIKKRARFNAPQIKYCKRTLLDAEKLLETAIKAEKIAINLNISLYNENQKVLTTFLSKFGKYVEKFGLDDALTTRAFCELLAGFFPNLKHLDLSDTGLDEDDQYFDENLLENRLINLTRVDFAWKTCDYVSVANIFRMAPNLGEIYDFPVVLVDALIDTQKVDCVKSLKYQKHSVDDTFKVAVEKLSTLELKLHSFSFEYLEAWPKEFLCSGVTRTFALKILQSSHNILQSLTLWKSEAFDFKSIPPLISLREIKFLLEDEDEDHATKFFAPNTDLPELLPNVSVLSISTLLSRYYYPISDITMRFPENQFLPWGSQIRELKLVEVSPSILRQLNKLFPSVEKLEFHVEENCNEFKSVFGDIGRYWCEIECLNLIVTSNNGHVEHRMLDTIFTGIPEEVLAQLGDPVSRNKFSSEEIQGFKESSPMRKFSKLKTLIFELKSSRTDCEFMQKLSGITSLSKEFGFQFLPQLKLIVRTDRDERIRLVSDMKTSLQRFINFEVESLE